MENNSNQQSVIRGSGFQNKKSAFQVFGLRFVFFGFVFRSLIGIWFLAFGILFNACSPSNSKPYDRSLVVTYAELTLLYEKEKMANKVVDSLYQVKVKEFFVEKGLGQETFKEVVDELSQHPEAWKMFIQDVTTAMDSLKRSGR